MRRILLVHSIVSYLLTQHLTTTVMLSVPERLTAIELVHEARDRIPLELLGITDSRLQWFLVGNVLVEIPGEREDEKDH